MHRLGALTRWATFLALGLLMLYTPLAILLVPGVLLLWLGRQDEPASLLVIVAASSISFWMAAFWYLEQFNTSYTQAFHAVAIFTLVGLGLLFAIRQEQKLFAAPSATDCLVLAVVIVLALLRFRAMWLVEVPAGADMSMHSYIAALIQNAQGIPESYYPLLPLEEFSVFPVGFHSLVALVASIQGLEIHRAGLIVSCFSYGLMLLACYALLRRVSGPVVAGMVAITFNYLTDDPASFAQWGGNPTVLASALFVVLVLLLMGIPQQRLRAALPAGAILAGIMATHTIVLVQAFYLLLLSLPFYFYWSSDWRRSLSPALVLGAIACVCMLPYLLSIDVHVVTPQVTDWIRGWVRESPHSWQGDITNFLWTIPHYAADRLGWKYLLLTGIFCVPIGLAWTQSTKRPAVIFAGMLLVAGMLLILNSQYWVLPLSYLIYPERVMLLLIVPLSMLLAMGLESALSRISKPRQATAVGLVLLITVVVPAVRNNEKDFVAKQAEYSSVTANDKKAIAWIAHNTPADAVIDNNYGDAGLWIPAIAGRAVTNAHVNVVYLDKLQTQSAPTYRFVGEKCVYPDCPPGSEGRLLIAFGEARVYQLDSGQ
ncbi:MAG: DUF6541 family protein [Halieaceae bacterium]